MGKYSTCVTDTSDNDVQYPELHKKRSNADGDIIMHKLPKNDAVKVAWINTILKDRKQFIQENLHTFVTTALSGWLINSSPVFNTISPNPVR